MQLFIFLRQCLTTLTARLYLLLPDSYFMLHILGRWVVGGGGGSTLYNDLYREPPPEMGYLFQASDI